ncbi:MAG: hypothetical protein ACJAYX_003731 [Planctomycetota bacterium]|jgi:hypothetical protein
MMCQPNGLAFIGHGAMAMELRRDRPPSSERPHQRHQGSDYLPPIVDKQ